MTLAELGTIGGIVDSASLVNPILPTEIRQEAL